MELPDLPPGCALDPGWNDRDSRTGRGRAFKGNGIGNARAKTTDRDELEALAAAQALRDERVRLWRDLWVKAQRCEELERENRSLRRLLEKATRS